MIMNLEQLIRIPHLRSMKPIKILLMSILVCTTYNCSTRKVDAKKELLDAMERFNTAFQSGNVAVISSMVTDNYLHTNGSSKSIRKGDWLDYLKKREKEIKSGNLEVIAYGMEEMEIEIHGKIALVTGKIVVTTKEKNETKTNEYRITNLWLKLDGNWKRAGFHDGKIN